MLRIKWEPISALLSAGLEDLAILHWEEAEIDKEDVPLALDLERARAAEKVGQHYTAGLRRNGALIGYASFMVMTAMFHRFTLHAFGTGLYVEREHRGIASLKLIDWYERELTALGVVKVYMAAKTPNQCDLLEKLGYRYSETVHSKILGNRHGRKLRSTSLHPA